MKKEISAEKWIIIFISTLLVFALLVGVIAYLVDPFYQFRYGNRTYFNNSAKFPGPGLVKNYEYDTLILGSSMTQNFDMELFRQELGAEPLHIGLGGIGIDELLSYIELSEQVGKCDSYYICIDQYMLTEAVEYRTPEYLFRDDPISMLQYLFSYEAWIRYIPLDIAITMLYELPIAIPVKIQQATDIDFLGNWENDFPFGEDIVIQNYLNDEYGVSTVELEGLSNRMKEWTDKLFGNLPGDKSRYHFFFPPYSVLFWYDAEQKGYFEIYQDAKRYFYQQATAYGTKVYDFQSAEFISDLDNYKDMTHYRAEINDWMVTCFSNQEYLMNIEHLDKNIAKLRDAVTSFSTDSLTKMLESPNR